MTALGHQALDALYWRAEILQAMYWMRGEGLAAAVEPAGLSHFLATDRATIEMQMCALCDEGYLAAAGSAYALTDAGATEGGRSFQDEFAELTRPAHYECAPGCWCHDPDHSGEPCPNRPRPDPAPEQPAEDDPDRDE